MSSTAEKGWRGRGQEETARVESGRWDHRNWGWDSTDKLLHNAIAVAFRICKMGTFNIGEAQGSARLRTTCNCKFAQEVESRWIGDGRKVAEIGEFIAERGSDTDQPVG